MTANQYRRNLLFPETGLPGICYIADKLQPNQHVAMKYLKIIQTILLALIGAVSLFMTTSVVFDLFGIREKEGNYVPFIVYTNMACAFIYLIASYTNRKYAKLSFALLVIASLALIIAFISMKVYINNGGIHEAKTVKAMIFRTVFTILMAVIGYMAWKKEGKKNS
jgi:glucan phosphoethanolaminetransferase (alkaline phosphatase superfamily)